MNNFKIGNDFLLDHNYIEALNKYYDLILNLPEISSILSFNLVRAIDGLFGSKLINEYTFYREQYEDGCSNVTSNFDIVICVHNALFDFKNCIASVLASSFGDVSIIIVNDGSDFETSEFINKISKLKFIKICQNPIALGYTRAANIGLNISNRNYVVLLNSDTVVSPYWLKSFVNVFDSDSKIGIVGPLSNTASWQSVPTIFDANGDWAENPLPGLVSLNKFAKNIRVNSFKLYPKIGFINGFCFVIKRELINQIGFFDELNFGRGYGEENDYSIRALSNGWLLSVADDCYVFHSQSKSYSHERRAILSRHAGEQLNLKHGSDLITTGVRSSRHNLQMIFNRSLILNTQKVEHASYVIKNNFSTKKVAYILPAGGVGGGSNIIVLEALNLFNLGLDVTIINLKSNQSGFEFYYPNLPFNLIYLESPIDIVNVYSKFDALIATLYRTVYWFDFLPLDHNLVLGYYIQDYEPYFFDVDTDEYFVSFHSYIHNKNLKLFSKSKWNADLILSVHGVDVHNIGISYDVLNFYPESRSAPSIKVNIVAMVRFDTPRRNPLMTLKILHFLSEKYSSSVNISIFGSDISHPNFSSFHSPLINNLGVLNSLQASNLFKNSDIFIDCSFFQAMGLTALECMASGVAVVGTNIGGLSEFIINGFNGFLVDPLNFDDFISSISILIEDSELRWKFQENALEVVKFNPVLSSFNMLNYLFL